MMLPIMLCSIGAMGIIAERFWSLQRKKILPPELVPQVWKLYREKKLDDATLRHLRNQFTLGLYFSGRPCQQSSRQEIHEGMY